MPLRRHASLTLLGLLLLPVSGLGQVNDIDVRTTPNALTQLGDNRRNPGTAAVFAGGDVSGDGLSDILIGAPTATDGIGNNSGMLYCWFGRPYIGLPADTLLEEFLDLTVPNSIFTHPVEAVTGLANLQGFQIWPENQGEQFGSAVAVGDFNGDSVMDFAVSAPAGTALSPRGRVYLFYGCDDRTGTVSTDAEIAAGRATEFEGRTDNVSFGTTLLMKDLNSDGLDDLIIASPGEGIGGVIDVIWGQPGDCDNPALPARLEIDDPTLVASMVTAAVATERLGTALDAAPIALSGPVYLFAGAPLYPNPATASGRVRSYQITETGTDRTAGVVSGPEWRGAFAQTGLGYDIKVRDLYGDPRPEIIVGAPYSPNIGGTLFETGRVYMNTIPDPPLMVNMLPPGPGLDAESGFLVGVAAGDHLGASLLVEEFDISAGPELIIGAPGAAPPGGPSNSGVIYVFTNSLMPLNPAGAIVSPSIGVPFVRISKFPQDYRAGTRLASMPDFDGLVAIRPDIIVGSAGTHLYPAVCVNPDNIQEAQCVDDRQGSRGFLFRSGILGFLDINPTEARGSWQDME